MIIRWSADGRWISSYTDGTVGGVHSQSGGINPSMHGQVVVEPNGGQGFGNGGQGFGNAGDPWSMRMTQAGTSNCNINANFIWDFLLQMQR